MGFQLSQMSDAEITRLYSRIQDVEEERVKCPIAFYRPHLLQREFHNSTKKNRWFLGGNGSGKTVAGAKEVVCMMLGKDPSGSTTKDYREPPVHGWCGSPDLKLAEDVLLGEVLKWMPPDEVFKYQAATYKLTLKNGSTLSLKSYDSDVTKWQSKALDFLWFDEQPPYGMYLEGCSRVNRTGGWILGTMTPLYANSSWTYDEVFLNRAGDPEIKYWYVHLDDNVHVTEENRERQKNLFRGTEEYDARISGHFITLAGRIHPKFDMDKHVIEPIPINDLVNDGFQFCRVMDMHPRAPNSTSWFAYTMAPKPIVYQIDELAIAGIHARDYGEAVVAKTQTDIEFTIVDTPESKEDTALGTSMTRELAEAGIYAIPPNRNFSMGVDRLNDYMTEDPCAFFIFNTCPLTIRYLMNYIWDNWKGNQRWEKNPKEKPRCKDDHLIRNAHFMILTMPPVNELREHVRNRAKKKNRRVGHGNHMRRIHHR